MSFVLECLTGLSVRYYFSGGRAADHGSCRAVLGSLGSELLLGYTRSPILLSGVFTVRSLCKPLLLIY